LLKAELKAPLHSFDASNSCVSAARAKASAGKSPYRTSLRIPIAGEIGHVNAIDFIADQIWTPV
jgi:hypothetical protein